MERNTDYIRTLRSFTCDTNIPQLLPLRHALPSSAGLTCQHPSVLFFGKWKRITDIWQAILEGEDCSEDEGVPLVFSSSALTLCKSRSSITDRPVASTQLPAWHTAPPLEEKPPSSSPLPWTLKIRSSSKLPEMVKDRKDWCCSSWSYKKSDMTEWLNNSKDLTASFKWNFLMLHW